jgi:platelet-activating factor acetylhydrolase
MICCPSKVTDNSLSWPELEIQPTDDTTLRREQINMRAAEMEQVIQVMTRLSHGENVARTSIHSPDFDWTRWRCIDPHAPILAGHSLGGVAAVRIESYH